ncbi:hypothetical protein Tco_1193115 [Tanacetum coccineum]
MQEPKRVKDYAYHKEKMMMCKQAEQGVPLQAEQADWLEDRMKRLMNKNWSHIKLHMDKDSEVSPCEESSSYWFSLGTGNTMRLVKKESRLLRSQFEGQLKEKSKVISDLKVKEGKDIDTMIEMDKQIKFLNEILYKRNQSIQTIHMLAPKCATYNGRSTFANPKYLKKAQSEKPRLYEIPYDTSDPANRFCPNGEETVTLEKEEIDHNWIKTK